MPRVVVLLAMLLGLGACGAAYIPQQVRQDADVAVRVVDMTAETVIQANRSTAYAPRSLPAVFSQVTGTPSGSAGFGGAPAGPILQQPQPNQVTLRTPPPFTAGPYEIGIGDVLVLATPTGGSSVEELSGLLAAQNRRQGYTVQDDGTITIPDVGRIRVGGLTLQEAEAAVFDELVLSQIDPSFSIEIAEFNSQRVTIGGAVAAPQVVPVRLGPLYLNEVIAAAGGFEVEDTDFATIRLYRDGTLYQIPVRDYQARSDLQRLPLRVDDSIFVDTEYSLELAQDYFEQQIRVADLRQRSRQEALVRLQTEFNIRQAQLQEARSNFTTRAELGAVERDYVYLTGEVGQPQRYALPYEQTSTLADALFEADGIAPSTGNPSQIYVLRSSSDPRDFSAVTAWRLDGSNAVNMVLATRFELRPNDIVFIAEQPITRWNRVVQQIVPSLITSGVAAATN